MFPNFTTKQPNPTQLVVDFNPYPIRNRANPSQLAGDLAAAKFDPPKKKRKRRKGRPVSTIEPTIKERKKICKRPSLYPCWLVESLPEQEQAEFFGTAATKNGGFWE